ncbi:hypothetical protein N656DRAFT_79183 [Canariomyces notabilis]|uniref:CCHC-type domain-containing protein n=1 Tax=Canariomyces notabilis TaxID=2074819 RepID=A0AAN6TEC7_9PEZI|nr:hypothetical protein N656DRAFT_79183 [Canariomyces arenarius]
MPPIIPASDVRYSAETGTYWNVRDPNGAFVAYGITVGPYPGATVCVAHPTAVAQYKAYMKTIFANDPDAVMWLNHMLPRPAAHNPSSLPTRSTTQAARPHTQGADDSCAWCRAQGRADVVSSHKMANCDWPSPLGDLPGCPKCNTMGHLFDNCPQRQGMSGGEALSDAWTFLIHNRGSLPPVRTTIS